MEPIKQEIINNIFENGDKLITGPILQTVLIDMIDDVNGKDQEILSKTGSWDNAVTQIPNLATKEEVTNLSESVARDIANVSVPEGVATEQWVQSQDYASKTYVNDAVSSSSVDLTGYATETWVQNQGYLTEHQDISNLATKTELNDTKNNLQGNITSLSESVARDIANVDLTGYATEQWVQSQGYLTEHQDISNLATKTELNDTKNILQSDMVTLSGSMAKSIEDSAIAIGTEIQNKDYASKTYVDNAVSSSAVDLTGYATEQWVQNQGYLKEHQDISGLATKTELTSVSESVQTDITNLSESVANSAVWKKGTGTDSIVQKLTGANETKTPTATGLGAIAIGSQTTASGYYSHAEGMNTKASGWYSHAEGGNTEASGDNSHAEGESTNALGNYSHAEGTGTNASGEYSHVEGLITNTLGDWSHAEGAYTEASGWYSHAEGMGTITNNPGEHAQGIFNHSSVDQIFSVGAGEGNPDDPKSVTRRNAISILEVPNSETQVVTASFFVQNVGGYDGTNPTPGTNDLATVIGEVSSIWKKGEGQDSIVKALTGNNETYTPTATGTGAIAIGALTTASAMYSHAEGSQTNASGIASHAEGSFTNASELASHAEGLYTIASNQYEHAQGRYNHTSSNQIFSIGTGNSDTDRRNAVSVLEVNNTGSYTASLFVQNIGGYDGTNPTPGTNDLATVINGMSTGGSSETLWKKGTGQDSLVQVITEDRYNPRASGLGAVAIGYYSHAEGNYSHAEGEGSHAGEIYSHAEGYSANTNGQYSHAEGYLTTAAGKASHAEGYNTSASNAYEHAQGINNHSSANQIFSVGAGDSIKNPDTQVVTETKRNAISVLAVPNAETQVVTASFFVQNVGGYDGTNPTPGTNDLATVINGLSSGGGTGDYLPLTGGTLTGNLQVNSSMGVGTGPQGTNCLAVGDSNTNTRGSHYALAVGENCQVEGAYGGVSLGRENVVNAAFGLATGFRCRTTKMSGYAGGCRSTASANFAFAAGFGAEATRVGQVVLGAYNELDPSGDNESTGSYAVILANGKSNTWHQDYPGNITRSNGLAIKWDGGIDIKYRDSTITLQDKLNEIESRISSGGTGTSTETWTFTLDNGSTVTKNVIIA